MFTVIWESAEDEILCGISHPFNENDLVQSPDVYSMLGNLCLDAYDVFSDQRMSTLIVELKRLKEDILNKEDLQHIGDIIDLANQCKDHVGSRLIFTPF